MKNKCFILLIVLGGFAAKVAAQSTQVDLRKAFLNPPESARPWVFWYWLHGAVSAEGITKDIEAMKEAGIGGAYLMPIKDTTNPSIYQPSARQLSPQWWKMVKHAMTEANRNGIKIALHVSDGFALAGGPWITPENSMQKLVWAQTNVIGGKIFEQLPQPKANEGFYRDVAILAFPSLQGAGQSTKTVKPVITTSNGVDAQFLVDPSNNKNFTGEDSCWVQYSFERPFTLRSITIRSRTNYQSNRLIIETSNDGVNFNFFRRLEAPRHGWQDWDSDYTHSIEEVTAKYFRFVYSKEGSEPGAEDLDAAKWRPSLKIMGIELSSEPRIHQYEGKNGEVWRVSKQTTTQQVPQQLCVPLKGIVDVSKYVDAVGRLNWNAPPGNWTIIRIGHTSTGHQNATGGGGKGLECDKFSEKAITLQFNNWVGEFYRQCGRSADSAVKIFHVDSWECGSQNWSSNFREEFKKRRGYDLLMYLPAVAGIPLESVDATERFLHDIRQTIAELLNDKFYGTLQKLASQKGLLFSAESVAPTMLNDGMQHYSKVDLPMGEFWLRSPTHDKPNDMLDAISGAHIYGKNIVQAEAFTQLRMSFDEHPGNIKALADRNFALGINKMVFHVFMHNPWVNRKPGITLDAIGLLFQRDQTWWPQAKALVEYVKRCQSLLQLGKPVTDIAVFTGEEYPRRSLLPERLVNVVPGLFGETAVIREQNRLSNVGVPVIKGENGVSYVANTTNAQTWLDPLRGYAYDSYNKDALLRMSSVKNGRIQLSTGANYRMLIIPGAHKLSPGRNNVSSESAKKIRQLINDGATVLVQDEDSLIHKIKGLKSTRNNLGYERLGKGVLIYGPLQKPSLGVFGIEPDFIATYGNGKPVENITWTHRQGAGFDIYFVSNQKDSAQAMNVSLRVQGRIPELWDAVTGTTAIAENWRVERHRTNLPLRLEANGSIFIVLQQVTTKKEAERVYEAFETRAVTELEGPWTVFFDTSFGGPKATIVLKELTNWAASEDSAIRYYSGRARYYYGYMHSGFPDPKKKAIWLELGTVCNMAEVFVNGISCGVAWTPPYRVDITKALKKDMNVIRVDVVNTWNNRMIGDSKVTPDKRIFNTVYPFKWENKSLLPAGLLGPVTVNKATIIN